MCLFYIQRLRHECDHGGDGRARGGVGGGGLVYTEEQEAGSIQVEKSDSKEMLVVVEFIGVFVWTQRRNNFENIAILSWSFSGLPLSNPGPKSHRFLLCQSVSSW